MGQRVNELQLGRHFEVNVAKRARVADQGSADSSIFGLPVSRTGKQKMAAWCCLLAASG